MNNYTLSKYNFFYEQEDSVIGLNLYNQHLFCISKEHYIFLQDFKTRMDELQSADPVFFSTMYKLGIIEDKGKNIPNILLIKNRKEVFASNEFHLTINATLNCNFSCWYCIETHQKQKIAEETKESIIEFIKRIINEKKISCLNLNWFGGEPLITYKTVLMPLSDRIEQICKEKGVSLISSITTNGYLITKDIITYFKKYNISTYQITLDGYRTEHDQTRYNKRGGSYDIIVNNICRLVKELPNIRMILRINYTQKNIESCTRIIESFPFDIRNRIIINLSRVWQEKDYSVNTLKKEMNILFT
ncbi:hypothetical protein FACS1894179_05940 [Bacteroidia bacterium]|nr:hypothetical protein FACS1894179_05940 [Bacteroidia bacterium]